MRNFLKKISLYFTAADLCIALAVCLVSIGAAAFAAHPDKAKSIVIELDGEVYASYGMEKLKNTPHEVVINSKYGKNILSIDKNGADMIYSDCPLQVDVNHRKITAPGEIIVCAPHKLVVYISGESSFDAISG